MQSATLDRDPQTYSLITSFNNYMGSYCNWGEPTVYNWSGDSMFPQTYLTNSRTDLSFPGGLPVPPNAILVHPAPQSLSVIGWRSPITGTVSVSGFAKSADWGSITWFIDKGNSNLTSGMTAYQPTQQTQSFQDGTGGINLTKIAVSQGDFLYFAVNPNGEYYCDTTQLDISIDVWVSPTATVNRVLPSCYAPGTKLTVTLNATPSSSTNTYAVEETPPAGWTVSNINDGSNGGVYESSTNKVKFGPFFDNQSRELKYDLTPSAGTGDKTFTGKVSVNGVSKDITGQIVIGACQLYHPADTNQDFRITMDELTAYGSAWKSGAIWGVAPNPIPVDYVIRAATIWKNGEKYKIDFSVGTYPLCWVNDPTRSERSDMTRDSSSTAVRQMNQAYQAGQAFTVSVVITPASTVGTYGIEEFLPAGWKASDADNGGSYDAVNSRVKFGPFMDNQTRTLTYQLTPPADAKGTYSLSGAVSFDGNKQPITGSGLVKDTVDPGDVNGDSKIDLADAVVALKVLAGLNPPKVFVKADVNSDNKIGLEEVIYILQKVAGLR